MQKPPNQTLRSAGNAARNRAQERQGGGRINVDSWYPELAAFQERGWRISWIAYAVSLSAHRVSEILRIARQRRRNLLEAPVFVDELSALDRACLEFTPAGFKLFFERFSGRKLQHHQEEWVQLFIDHRNLMLNVPPRHGKSTIFSVWIPTWLLCINRNEQILVISKTRQLAQKFCREIEFQLATNEELIRTYGRFAPDRSGEVPWRPGMGELLIQGRSRETKSGDLSIQSRGMEQQILGMEATVAIVDDPTDSKTAQSPVAHKEEMRKLHEEILSRIEPKIVGGAAGRVVIVGQRVHYLDLYGEIQDQRYERGPRRGDFLWHVELQRAVLDWENEVTLWPEKFDWEEIMLTYERVGGHQAFETMYQQNPIPEGSALIRQEWLTACHDPDRPGGQGVRDADRNTLPIVRVVSVDPSPTEWNAMVVADVLCGVPREWGCSILEVRRWRGKGVEFKRNVTQAIHEYRPDYLVVEDSSFFKWFSSEPWWEDLKAQVKLIEHHTGVNKLDQELGADSLSGDFEMGRIRLPYGDEAGRQSTQLLENEALVWPLGRTYDCFMATWFIKWNRKFLRPRFKVQDTFFGTKVQPNSVWRREAERKKREERRERIFAQAS